MDQRLEDKIQKIVTADNRICALATPSSIPSPFFDLLPQNCRRYSYSRGIINTNCRK